MVSIIMELSIESKACLAIRGELMEWKAKFAQRHPEAMNVDETPLGGLISAPNILSSQMATRPTISGIFHCVPQV